MLIFSMITTIGQQEYLRTKAQVIADAASLAVAQQAQPVQGTVWLNPSNERPRYPQDYTPVYNPKTCELEGYRLTTPEHEYWALAGYQTQPDQALAQQIANDNEEGPGGKLVKGQTAVVNGVAPMGYAPEAQDVEPQWFIPYPPTPAQGAKEARPVTNDLYNGNVPESEIGPMDVDVSVTVTQPTLFDWFYTFMGQTKEACLSASRWAKAYAKKSLADIQYADQVNFRDLNKQDYPQ
ncbi:MAG: Tad domain-containing protein [Peptococcaceae bacterium]|jgi:hypothetical protein|nr:Tad domain-containing protein [Peptococcaceae bacterium]